MIAPYRIFVNGRNSGTVYVSENYDEQDLVDEIRESLNLETYGLALKLKIEAERVISCADGKRIPSKLTKKYRRK